MLRQIRTATEAVVSFIGGALLVGAAFTLTVIGGTLVTVVSVFLAGFLLIGTVAWGIYEAIQDHRQRKQGG